MSTLKRIEHLIEQAHDEFVIAKKWDVNAHSPVFKEALNRIYPFGAPYYFEGNPSFLNQYLNPLDMERYPLIMARDGVLPFCDFFLRHHKPHPGFDSIILAPKRFESLIPPMWKERVALYQIELPLAASSPKKVLVGGSPSSYTYWLKKPEEVFQELRDKIPKDSEVEFFLVIKERPFFNLVDESAAVAATFKNLYKTFGVETKIHTDNTNILTHDFSSGTAYCDLADAPYIIEDNFFVHWCASKNVGFLGAEKLASPKESLKYPLSPFHSVLITLPGANLGRNFNQIAVKSKMAGQKPNIGSQKFHRFIRDLFVSGEISI